LQVVFADFEVRYLRAVAPMFRKLSQLLKDVQVEMGKVTWPTRDELTSSTVIVLVVSLALALFIFIADLFLTYVMKNLVLI
jgi:preprotein translocase subunit SecE